MLSFNKVDAYDQPLRPGDVCVYASPAAGLEYVVYKEPAWGGRTSKGTYGRFITAMGLRSLQYRNVVLAYTSPKRDVAPAIKSLTRKFYEE